MKRNSSNDLPIQHQHNSN